MISSIILDNAYDYIDLRYIRHFKKIDFVKNIFFTVAIPLPFWICFGKPLIFPIRVGVFRLTSWLHVPVTHPYVSVKKLKIIIKMRYITYTLDRQFML